MRVRIEIAVVAFVSGVMLGYVFRPSLAVNPSSSPVASQNVAGSAPAVPPALSGPATPAPTEPTETTPSFGDAVGPSSTWKYMVKADPMTDKKILLACIESENEVKLNAPYEPTTAELCIRQSSGNKLESFVYLNGDGQFICTSYSGCSVRIRFGEKKPSNFSAAEPTDHSSNFVFIENGRRVIRELKSADEVLVQAAFYEAGTQTMRFRTVGLEWPPKG